MYTQEGYILTLHEHVPQYIRQRLYNREKESLETYKKATMSVANHPIPITITVLSAPAGAPAPDTPSKSTLLDRLDIPGPLEG